MRASWPICGRHKWYVVGALLALIGDAVVQLQPQYLVKVAIDRYIAQGDLLGLNSIAFVYLGVLMRRSSRIRKRTCADDRPAHHVRHAHADLRSPAAARSFVLTIATLSAVCERGDDRCGRHQRLFTSGVVAAFGDLFMLLGIMVTLLWMDWRLALITFSVLPLILVLAQWFRRNVRESYRKVRLRIARINAFLNEHINGMATVQLFRREQVNFTRFESINAEHRDANVEQIFYYAVFLPAVEFVAAIATALILWFGAVRDQRGADACSLVASFSTRGDSSDRSANVGEVPYLPARWPLRANLSITRTPVVIRVHQRSAPQTGRTRGTHRI